MQFSLNRYLLPIKSYGQKTGRLFKQHFFFSKIGVKKKVSKMRLLAQTKELEILSNLADKRIRPSALELEILTLEVTLRVLCTPTPVTIGTRPLGPHVMPVLDYVCT